MFYCGNNQNNVGNKPIGNRYQCLRQGIGKGLHSKLNPSYGIPYQPIDNRKFYCGLLNQLPNGYDWIGRHSDCFQKGFGIGQLLKWQKYGKYYNWFRLLCWVCICFVLGITLYLCFRFKKYWIAFFYCISLFFFILFFYTF